MIETNHDLGICTPYAAQARLIQKLLEEHSLDNYVHCGTVHRFQGDERRIVLLEIPESYGGYRAIGQFVQGVPPDHAGARLISVAVSRAQEHFVVLANLTYLDKHLPSLSLMRGILHEMQQQGHVEPVRELLKYPIDRDVASSSSLDHVTFNEMAKSMGIFNAGAVRAKLANDIQSAKESVCAVFRLRDAGACRYSGRSLAFENFGGRQGKMRYPATETKWLHSRIGWSQGSIDAGRSWGYSGFPRPISTRRYV